MEEPWTILELAELAADALAAAQPAESAGAAAGSAGGEGSGVARATRANGRVRDVPNERLVRWYVTVGLVDPPLSRRGRVARYGRRHLLQLVAVKRRQAEGRSLADIQAELAGATDETLAAVARVPVALSAPDLLPAAPARFWARSAAQRDPAAAEEPAHGDPADRGRSRLVHGVRLAPGVTLLLEGAAREPGPDDVTAILNAARALLAELASRRLHEPGPEHPADVPGPPPGVGSRT
jgi:DNA-binding transcriptional MerR regulator